MVSLYTYFRIQELKDNALPNIKIALVGNKVDLDHRQVSRSQAQSIAEASGYSYWEVSAKQNLGIEQMFRGVASLLPCEPGSAQKSRLNINSEEPAAGGC